MGSLKLIHRVPEMSFLSRFARGINTSKVPGRGVRTKSDMSVDKILVKDRNRKINVIFPSKDQATSNSNGRNKRVIRKGVRSESFRNGG